MVQFHYEDSDLMLHHTLTDNPSEAMFPLHAHDRYELYCFLHGQGYYTVEGHDYPLSPGSLLMMRDGEHTNASRFISRLPPCCRRMRRTICSRPSGCARWVNSTDCSLPRKPNESGIC